MASTTNIVITESSVIPAVELQALSGGLARSTPDQADPSHLATPLNVVLLMAGQGTRFSKAGYDLPKPLVNVQGRPMVSRVLESIGLREIDHVHVGYRTAHEDICLPDTVRSQSRVASGMSFYPVYGNTRGAAESFYSVLARMDESLLDQPVITVDCDTIYERADIVAALLPSLAAGHGAVTVFGTDHPDPIYSYVRLAGSTVQADEHGYARFLKGTHPAYATCAGSIDAIVEKKRISDLACSGVYAFPSARLALQLAKHALESSVDTKELYMSNLVAACITAAAGGVDAVVLPDGAVQCVGTPAQLAEYNVRHVHRMRVAFDLDNTLVTFPRVSGDYSTVGPIDSAIALAQRLVADGHHIIIHTARRMRTHRGDVAKVRADALPCILATLTKFNIPCHELVLGKPWADVYIDDKAVNPTTADLESFIGVSYGLDSRVASLSSDLGMIDARDFNRVELSLPGQVSKRGPADIMAGELYWYLTAPEAARRIVPTLLGVRDGGSEISTQLSFVQGNTFSHMLCNRVLLPKHVAQLLASLQALHALSPVQDMDTVRSAVAAAGIDVESDFGKKLAVVSSLTPDMVRAAWQDKLWSRYTSNDAVYASAAHEAARETCNEIQLTDATARSALIEGVATALQTVVDTWSPGFEGPAVIHGDPVFSNALLLTRGDQVCLIDMRGCVGNVLTVAGDPLYDWAKVFQSLMGYDLVLLEGKDRWQQRPLDMPPTGPGPASEAVVATPADAMEPLDAMFADMALAAPGGDAQAAVQCLRDAQKSTAALWEQLFSPAMCAMLWNLQAAAVGWMAEHAKETSFARFGSPSAQVRALLEATASLYLSLIPLHDSRAKCGKYFALGVLAHRMAQHCA